ncbi:MAG: hypothetical protein FWB95_08240 [Treponema sp.]|nr:hypothetical protein [Treponema sp.]
MSKSLIIRSIIVVCMIFSLITGCRDPGGGLSSGNTESTTTETPNNNPDNPVHPPIINPDDDLNFGNVDEPLPPPDETINEPPAENPDNEPAGVIKYNFVSPQDENITLGEAQTLSWAANDSLIINVKEEFDSYQWYVDGAITGETGNSITLNARDFSSGAHIVTLKVFKGSTPYTKTIKFTVN